MPIDNKVSAEELVEEDRFFLMVTGHRKLGGDYRQNAIYKGVQQKLHEMLLDAKQTLPQGVVAISGMAPGVDTIFAQEAISLGIPIHAYVPAKGQEAPWPGKVKQRYRQLLDKCEEVIFVGDASTKKGWGALMQDRNIAMVDAASHAIVMSTGAPGGTENCLAYIKQEGRSYDIFDPSTLSEVSAVQKMAKRIENEGTTPILREMADEAPADKEPAVEFEPPAVTVKPQLISTTKAGDVTYALFAHSTKGAPQLRVNRLRDGKVSARVDLKLDKAALAKLNTFFS